MQQLRMHLPRVDYPTDVSRDTIFENPQLAALQPSCRMITLRSNKVYINKILAHSSCWAGGSATVVVDWTKNTSFFVSQASEPLQQLLSRTSISALTMKSSPDEDSSFVVRRTLVVYFRLFSSLSCTTLSLYNITVPLTPLFEVLSTVSVLRNISVERCCFDARSFSALVRSCTHLCSLTCRDVPEEQMDWKGLGISIATNNSINRVELERCGLSNHNFALFCGSATHLLERPRLALILADESLNYVPRVLIAFSSLWSVSLTELGLRTEKQSTDSFSEALCVMIQQYTVLDALLWQGAVEEPSVIRKVLKGVTECNRKWRKLEVERVGEIPASALRRLCSIFRGSSLSLSGCGLRPIFSKVIFVDCVSLLTRLNLSLCNLSDECLGHLAAAFDRSSALPLRYLNVLSRAKEVLPNHTGKGLLRLCKCLRRAKAPSLREVNIMGHALPAVAAAVLVEQVTATLGILVLTLQDAPRDAGWGVVVSALLKRQKSDFGFKKLDIYYGGCSHAPHPPPSHGDLLQLRSQMLIRLIPVLKAENDFRGTHAV